MWQIGSSFQPDFMRHALCAGVVMAAICSFLGVYVVLRRMAFVGVALAEMSSAGVALALLVGIAPMAGALALMLLAVVLLSVRWSPKRVPQESYIGVGYAVAVALGILLIAKSAQGEAHMLQLLYGNVLTVSPRETGQMVAVFAAVALVHWLFAKEFLLVSFDRDYADTLGLHSRRWQTLLNLTLGVVIAFAIRSVGMLLTFSMLVLPAVAALLVTNRMRHAWLVAPIFGIVPVVLGLHLSLQADLPAAAAIVALSFVLMLLAVAVRMVATRGRLGAIPTPDASRPAGTPARSSRLPG